MKNYLARPVVQQLIKGLEPHDLLESMRKRGFSHRSLCNIKSQISQLRVHGKMLAQSGFKAVKPFFTDEEMKIFKTEKEWQLEDSKPSNMTLSKPKRKVKKVFTDEQLKTDKGELVTVISGCEKYDRIATVKRKSGECAVLDLATMKII